MNEEIEALYALLGVKPDEASVTDAVNTLVKAVKSKLQSSIYGGKNGVITLPATIEGSYKNGKEIEKEIKDAYAAIYEKAKQMADESVSLTLKDIQDFKKQVNKFSKMTAQKTGNDAIANARNNLNQAVSDYQDFINQLRKESSVQQKTQVKANKKKKAQKRASRNNDTLPSDEEITNDIARENKRRYAGLKNLSKGAGSAKAREVGSDINLGLRQPALGGPFVDTKRIIRNAVNGTYFDTNSLMKQSAETQKASKELAKKTYKAYHITPEGTESLAQYLQRRRKPTQSETDSQLSKIVTNQAVKEQKNISKGKPNADVQKFQDSLKASFGFLTKSFGPSIWKGLEQNVNAVMSPFAGGTFKITDDEVKGEGKNYAELAKILNSNFKTINEFFKQNPEMEQLAEVNRQLKAAANISQDAYEETLKSNAKLLQAFGYNPGRISTDTKSTKSSSGDNTILARLMKESNDLNERQTNFAQIGNIEQEENTEVNKKNATTGMDSDRGKDEVVNATKEVDTTLKNMPFANNGSGGNGGNSTKIDLGDEGSNIFKQIYDTLVSINSYTIAIFDLLPKLKLTIKREKRHKSKDDTTNIDTPGKTSFGASMEINKIWDDIAEEFANYIKPIREAMLPVVAGGVQDKTAEAFQQIRDSGKTIISDKTDPAKLRHQQAVAEVEQARQDAIEKNKKATPVSSAVELSQDTSVIKQTLGDTIKKAFGLATSSSEVDRIKAMNQKQREQELADITSTFGISDKDRDPTATGDKARAQRMKSVYGYRQQDNNAFKDLKLTPGLNVDINGITDAFQTMIQKNMFSAQTGVKGLGDVLKLSLGGIGMPSLEKSRAQADAANEILGIFRQVMQETLASIQNKETVLRGMEAKGDAKFDDQGNMVSGTNEAMTLFAQLEEQKASLNGVVAELNKMDLLVAETDGNMDKFFKKLGFVSPELKKCNAIIGNINSGLDKNGKAIKFQSRFQETMNYSFQLMTRYIGQIFKNWMMMLNPITLIKKAFSDFASYDVKWQRTMNVIKYNIRAIIRPFMQWLAQQFVNIIGLANALIKGLGKAFGKKWDLFDQSAANAEKMREDLEAAANVTAGFDELHDIGSDNSAANDLMGDIYTPQWDNIYKSIEGFAEKIGNVLNDIHKLTEGWSFWDWLAVIGGALAGYKILKWLINMFSKKNPLESVANGLSFLEKAVGWSLLIWAFTAFTKALTDFVDCMKTANWETIVKSLLMLGGAFTELVGSILLLEFGSFGIDPKTVASLSALVWVFSEFVKAIIPFIELMWDICDIGDEGKEFEILAGSLSMLALSFIELIGGVAGIEKITELIGLDWQKLAGLSAIVGALDLFVAAIVPFIKAISEIEGDKWDTIIPMIVGLAGAFVSLAVGVGTISKAFSTMDWKAIAQLYVVAGVFELFMGVLVLFVNAIKDISFETLAGGTVLIAGAFLSLAGAIALLAPSLKMLDWTSIIEFGAIMLVFAAVIGVLKDFVQSLQDLSSEQLMSGLIFLAGALAAITIAISALAVVFTGVVTTGIGAAAMALLALVLGAVSLVILSIADLVRALGESGEGIKLILEGISEVVQSIGDIITGIIDIIVGKIADLAVTIAHEIGETIRTVIETVGNIITKIIDSIVNAIPNLLQSIVNFCHDIGPAIENTVEAIIRSVTKLVNFVVSAVEYLANLVIGALNKISVQVPDWVPGLGGKTFGFNLQKIEIPRFVPKYEKGTNYVPNDGLAYLHQGEAVVPKKYNTPYQQQGLSSEEREYMNQMVRTMSALNATISQGIPVKGEFKQRGNDLVAVVEKANNRNSNNILNNKVYAR